MEQAESNIDGNNDSTQTPTDKLNMTIGSTVYMQGKCKIEIFDSFLLVDPVGMRMQYCFC